MATRFPTFTKTFHHEPYGDIDPTNSSLSAAGKVVLVTGGGRSIGKSITTAFAKAGARAIVIIGRTEANLTATKKEIEGVAQITQKDSSPPITTVHTFVADISDVERMNLVFSAVRQEIGQVDVCVNNAAYLPDQGSVAQSDLNDFWHGFEINVKGGIIVTQAFLKHAAASSATLINITSGALHIPYIPGYASYSSSKGALLRIMDYVQAENPTLRVFNLQPGTIESDMSRKSDQIAEDDIGMSRPFFAS